MSSRFQPPSSIGAYTVSLLTLILFLSPQRNFHVHCSRHFSTLGGMPCTFVRYCVIPLTTISMIRWHPSIVGCPSSHLLRFSSIVSRVHVHTSTCLMPFPTHAPRVCTASPSLATLMSSGIWELVMSGPAKFRWWQIASRCEGVPIGSISVFFYVEFCS